MSLLAHGGTAGLIAEITIGLTVGALLLGIWLRERRRRTRGERRSEASLRE